MKLSPALLRTAAALTLAAMLLGAPQRAEANSASSLDGLFEGLLIGLLVLSLEPLIPDLQMEFGEGVDGVDLTLAWPLSVSFGAVGFDAIAVGLTAFIEPQYRIADDANRLVFGGRIPIYISDGYESPSWSFGPGVFLEGGGIVGDDGNGFIAGGGLMVGGAAGALGLGYRLMQLGGDTRNMVTLELHLALPIFVFWE